MDLPAATRLSKKLVAAGFLGLGGFHPEPGDAVPDIPGQGPAATVLMIGSAGPALWAAFTASPEYSDTRPDPLDRFTRRALAGLAGDFGLLALFPFDGPPYFPFQRWALRCGGFSQSPLGVLAHHRYGPWAGLRAAFLSSESFGRFEKAGADGPCPTCVEKPCIAACPVGAISLETGYDVPGCRDHMRSQPDADCWSGCLARRACPFGIDDRQSPENARYHMENYVRLI